MSDHEPTDIRRLCAYVRRKLKTEGHASFILHKRRVYVTLTGHYGDTLPAIMVAQERGGCVTLTPNTRGDHLTFQAAKFRLRDALFLARLFTGLVAKFETHKDDRKPNGETEKKYLETGR